MVSEQIYDAGFAAVRAHLTGAVTGAATSAGTGAQEGRA